MARFVGDVLYVPNFSIVFFPLFKRFTEGLQCFKHKCLVKEAQRGTYAGRRRFNIEDKYAKEYSDPGGGSFLGLPETFNFPLAVGATSPRRLLTRVS